MNAINQFYSMLYTAMRESMPGAQISASGAYVWRGYRIDSFQELAFGQYYCLTYPNNPQTLLFQEGYLDPSHRANEFERQHEIKQGSYYYPFSEALDLIHTRFFDLNRDEQFASLQNFVARGAEQALIWQQSEARERVTGTRFQQGSMPRHVPVRVAPIFERVDGDFLQAWECQTVLLMKLQGILESFTGAIWVRPNASIHNFGFRGLRLKLNGAEATSRWSIYFDDFERLRFKIPKGRRNSYNLVENGYFDLSSDEQTNQLTDFAQASIGITI